MSIFTAHAGAAEERLENPPAHSAAAKDLAENIEWIMKSSAKPAALGKSGMTEAVVGGAFIPVH